MIFLLGQLGCTKYTTRPQVKSGTPVWFQAPKKFVQTERDGTAPLHSFFDLVPEPVQERREVNFVMTTPVGGHGSYNIDLISGKLYLKNRHCRESDVWGRRRQVPTTPPASFGFIPRLLDQTGEPQQVAVFGRSRYFHPFRREGDQVQRIRIVGGGIHQYCAEFPCEVNQRWLSRLVLIGVNPNDPELSSVQTLDQLKQRVNWDQFTAFMENGFGRNLSGTNERPAYRFTSEINGARAFEHAFDRGHLFEFSELTMMRRSCHALYDFFWDSSELVRKNMRERFSGENRALEELAELERLRRQTPEYLFSNVRSGEREERSAPPSRVPELALRNHSVFLNHFLENYGREFRACSRFVRNSSVKDNPRRHWYFAYIQLYLSLEDLGYVYVCSRRAWSQNFTRADGSKTYDPFRERANCLPSQFDQAFDSAVTMMTGIRRSLRGHWRYIEYDTQTGGSHQPLFAWVYDNGKRRSCEDVGEREFLTMPSDVRWDFFTEGDDARGGVIR